MILVNGVEVYFAPHLSAAVLTAIQAATGLPFTAYYRWPSP